MHCSDPVILDLLRSILPNFEGDQYSSINIQEALQSPRNAIDRISQSLEDKEKELAKIRARKEEQDIQTKLSELAIQERDAEIERIKKEIEGL